MSNLACVILAAGLSTRMKSRISKVIFPLAGRPVLHYPIMAARDIGAKRVVVVRSPLQTDILDYLDKNGIESVVQKEAMGTANAVMSAEKTLSDFSGYVLILCGDVPLITKDTIRQFVTEVSERKSIMGVVTMTLNDPGCYGRIIRDPDGSVISIVEHRDASDSERKIREVNSGVICVDSKWLFRSLKNVGVENAKGEFYLTDLVGMAVKEGKSVLGFRAPNPEDFLGINTRIDYSTILKIMNERINTEHMLNGVGVIDSGNTRIDIDVKIGQDTVIMPYSFILGETRIGNDCIIENSVVIKDCKIGNGVYIKAYSVLEGSVVADEAIIGPFARLRPESKLGKGARVGNFVELKKCEMKEGAKANHLTYLGDATIGKKVNVGCGTITCNYDGIAKYKTVVGDGAFIGSDTQFVAPVKIGKEAIIGAGSTITKDVPAGSLALSRANQVIIRGWAKRRHCKKK